MKNLTIKKLKILPTNKKKSDWFTIKTGLSLVILLVLGLILVALLVIYPDTDNTSLRLEHNLLMIFASMFIAGAIATALTITWNLSKFPFQPRLTQWFSNSIILLGFIILLFGITLPFLFFLIIGSFEFLANYLGELLLSFIIIVPIGLGWMVMQRITDSKKLDHIEAIIQRAEQINERVSEVEDLYKHAVMDFNQKKISKTRFKELEQTWLLMKWIVFDDKTGYYELKEDALYGLGLFSKPYSIMKKQVDVLRHEQNGKQEYVEQLEFLLETTKA